jgi:hypothetical protein
MAAVTVKANKIKTSRHAGEAQHYCAAMGDIA